MQRFFDSLKKGFLTSGVLFFAGYKPGKTRFFSLSSIFSALFRLAKAPTCTRNRPSPLGWGAGFSAWAGA